MLKIVLVERFMTKDNNFFDDLARLAGSSVSTAINIKNDMKEYIKGYISKSLQKMDIVSRDEHEALLLICQKNAQTISELSEKLSKLEQSIDKK